VADDWEERNIIQEDLKAQLGYKKIGDVEDKLNDLSADWDTLAADGTQSERKADPKFLGAWTEHRGIFGYTLRAELVYQLKHALQQRKDFELRPATKHVLVDEYQDLNKCDLSVIEAIRDRGASIYAAGDDDQSIYGFRHAQPEGIRGFLGTFQPSADLSLATCVRCDKAIIDLAKFVAALDHRRLEKPLEPRKDAGGGQVALLQFASGGDEANGVASLCRYFIDEADHDPDEILILLRSDFRGAFSNPLRAALEAAGVSVVSNVGGDSPLDSKFGRTVLSLLRLCLVPDDSLGWRTLIQERNNKLGTETLRGLYDLARSQGTTFAGAVFHVAKNPSAHKVGGRIKGEVVAIEEDVARIGKILMQKQGESTPRPLAARIKDALTALGGPPDERETLPEFLIRIADEADATSLEELLTALAVSGGAPEQEITEGAVNILTMHRAKGLSARTVIIMAAEDEYVPGRHEGLAQDDERRLLYVSLTRAKERLLITYANERDGAQRHTGRTSGDKVRSLTRYLRDCPVAPEDGDEFIQGLIVDA
jgi:DNA helicase-2/ATP-dependent DNA helicase PcrA